MNNVLAICIGACAGALARWQLGLWFNAGGWLPWAATVPATRKLAVRTRVQSAETPRLRMGFASDMEPSSPSAPVLAAMGGS